MNSLLAVKRKVKGQQSCFETACYVIVQFFLVLAFSAPDMFSPHNHTSKIYKKILSNYNYYYHGILYIYFKITSYLLRGKRGHHPVREPEQERFAERKKVIIPPGNAGFIELIKQ